MKPDRGRPHLPKRLLWCAKCNRDVRELHSQGLFVGEGSVDPDFLEEYRQQGGKLIDISESSVAATAFCHGSSVNLLITFSQLEAFLSENQPLTVFGQDGLPMTAQKSPELPGDSSGPVVDV